MLFRSGPLIAVIVLDGWLFAFIPETEDCAGWSIGRMQNLMERVQNEWDKYGNLPSRLVTDEQLPVPALDAFAAQLKGSAHREISTTMAFVRLLSTLVKDPGMGDRVVPIVPDEARTFGMEGMFRQLGIYSSVGQRYTPHDAAQILFYKEDHKGQILEEGINEAGAMSAWIAAGTSYANHNLTQIPFYIFYSMFGF